MFTDYSNWGAYTVELSLIPKVRTESAQKGTLYTGAQAFNNLPPHQKKVDSIVIFKTQLNNLFLEW